MMSCDSSVTSHQTHWLCAHHTRHTGCVHITPDTHWLCAEQILLVWWGGGRGSCSMRVLSFGEACCFYRPTVEAVSAVVSHCIWSAIPPSPNFQQKPIHFHSYLLRVYLPCFVGKSLPFHVCVIYFWFLPSCSSDLHGLCTDSKHNSERSKGWMLCECSATDTLSNSGN